LLLAERARPADAREELQRALDLDPQLTGAAYNLAVLVGKDDPRRAADLARRAAELEPQQAKYVWTSGYYAAEAGDLAGARSVLERLVRAQPGYADGWTLLGAVLERQGRAADARRPTRALPRTRPCRRRTGPASEPGLRSGRGSNRRLALLPPVLTVQRDRPGPGELPLSGTIRARLGETVSCGGWVRLVGGTV